MENVLLFQILFIILKDSLFKAFFMSIFQQNLYDRIFYQIHRNTKFIDLK